MKTAKSIRIPLMFCLLIFAFFALLIISINTGSVSISPAEIFRIISVGISDSSKAANVILKIRLPRLLAAAVLGGALSVSGFLLQTFFRNPIAGPYVLGISNGARMFVGLAMIFVLRHASGVPFIILIAASFLGSLLVTGFVLFFSQRVQSMSVLLVLGIMIGSICTAVTDFIITFADEANVANLHSWSMGSFSAISFASLKPAAIVIFAAVLAAFLLSKPISAFLLGENYALSMGVNVKLFRLALIGLSSLLSATVTALSGPISFVGVAVPHITKLLFRTSKPVILIPSIFLLGSVFCMGCDLIARTAFAPSELAISTVTAIFGAPVVILLMLKRQRRSGSG
ncbi:MAG: iron ABC transporter permease [Clostridia bacterium]|nr:iron ABC transporter permease [Clostridia bacterium]